MTELFYYNNEQGNERAKVHCPSHGYQEYSLIWDACIMCLDEFDEELNKAWPHGCPSGHGEND